MSEGRKRRVEAVWGAKGIGGVIGVSERKAFDLLERRVIPARKHGASWQSTIGELEDFLLGQPAPHGEDWPAELDGGMAQDAFNPQEARDPVGKWTKGGGAHKALKAAVAPKAVGGAPSHVAAAKIATASPEREVA